MAADKLLSLLIHLLKFDVDVSVTGQHGDDKACGGLAIDQGREDSPYMSSHLVLLTPFERLARFFLKEMQKNAR